MNTDTHFSSNSNEWYTPPEIIESVLTVLGHIDLDPCSQEQPTIPAKMYYTQWSDGLSQIWCGNIYMNPPYGREISKWVDHLIREYWADHVDQAIALVPARIDTKWFNALSDFQWCAVRGRLKFSGNNTGAPFPSAIFYLGDCEEKFVEEFSKWGRIFGEVRE